MEPIPLMHTVTNGDLITQEDLFPEGTMVGEQVELTEEQYEVLGLTVHTLTNEDISENPEYSKLGLVAGDRIEIKLPSVVTEEQTN